MWLGVPGFPAHSRSAMELSREELASVLEDKGKPIAARMRAIFFLKGKGGREEAAVLERGEKVASAAPAPSRPVAWNRVACCQRC